MDAWYVSGHLRLETPQWVFPFCPRTITNFLSLSSESQMPVDQLGAFDHLDCQEWPKSSDEFERMMEFLCLLGPVEQMKFTGDFCLVSASYCWSQRG